MTKKGNRRWWFLAAGTVIIVLIFYNLSRSPEWANFRWERLWALMAGARPGLLLLTLIGVFGTYFVRALRWQLFLRPIKKASLWVLFKGQILGFSSIYLIGRPGEFVRPAYIAKRENVSMSAMLAVWLLERIFDTLFLLLLFAAALNFRTVAPGTARGSTILLALHRGGNVALLFALVLTAGLFFFWLRSKELTAWMIRGVRFLPPKALRQAGRFVRSFATGLSVIQSWKELLGAVFLSAVVWALNTTVFWLIFQSLRGEVAQLRLAGLGGHAVLRRPGAGRANSGHRGRLPGGNYPGPHRTLQRVAGGRHRRCDSRLDSHVRPLPGFGPGAACARRTDPQKAGGAGGRGKRKRGKCLGR